MSPQANQRRKPPQVYDILIVPSREGTPTRRYKLTAVRLWTLCCLAAVASVVVVLAVLIFTPVGAYVPIPNPELERRYGREIVETQQRVRELAERVMLLSDYNAQLRKALGEGGARDTVRGSRTPTLIAERAPASSMEGAPPSSQDTGAPMLDEFGDMDLMPGSYAAIITNPEGFRATFPLIPPSGGYLTRGFDPERKHHGIDYAAKRGSPVYAAADGYVMFSGWTYEDGNMLILSHGGGYTTVYKHAQLLLKSRHSYAARGELIAQTGDTGSTSEGPHLHFELWKDGTPIDPREFLLTSSPMP